MGRRTLLIMLACVLCICVLRNSAAFQAKVDTRPGQLGAKQRLAQLTLACRTVRAQRLALVQQNNYEGRGSPVGNN